MPLPLHTHPFFIALCAPSWTSTTAFTRECASDTSGVPTQNVCGLGQEVWLVSQAASNVYTKATVIVVGDLICIHAFHRPILIVSSANVARELLEKRGGKYSDRPYSILANKLYVIRFPEDIVT